MADRDTLTRSLSALAAELDTLDRGIRWAGLKAASARSEADHHGGRDDPDSRELATHHRSDAAAQDARRKSLVSIRTRLDVVGAALAQDDVAWKSERANFEWTVDRAFTVAQRIDAPPSVVAAPPVAPPPMPPAPPEAVPLLSACLGAYLTDLLDDGKRLEYANGLVSKCREFVALIGDRPITEYVPRDLKAFAKTLADLPTNWTKLRQFKNSTSPEIVARIAALREAGKPVPACQSETTIATYVAAVAGVFRWIAVEYNARSPFADLRVSAPGHAPKAVVREPFTVEELNRWFGFASKERRADDYWLPLLGVLTGARIGELAYLQGGDIKQIGGHWVADLSEPLVVNGKEEERQIKNEGSRRYFALHQALVEFGFVKFAKARRDSDWVFPGLHEDIADPADTASKRHGRLLRRQPIEESSRMSTSSSRSGRWTPRPRPDSPRPETPPLPPS